MLLAFAADLIAKSLAETIQRTRIGAIQRMIGQSGNGQVS